MGFVLGAKEPARQPTMCDSPAGLFRGDRVRLPSSESDPECAAHFPTTLASFAKRGGRRGCWSSSNRLRLGLERA